MNISSFFPLFFNLKDKRILVIGGGAVALRKVRLLQPTGARITVIAPEMRPEIGQLKGVRVRTRMPASLDFEKPVAFVVIATDDAAENGRIRDLCRERGLPVNCCDSPEDSDFITGSTLSLPPILASVISSGVPGISRLVRKRLESVIDRPLLDLAELMIEIRPIAKKVFKDRARREEFLESCAREETVEWVRKDGIETVRKELLECLSS